MSARTVIGSINAMIELQNKYQTFLDERPTMKRNPVWATERAGHELEELYVELVDEPTSEQKEAIGSEIADVFMFLFVVANNYGIDIGEAITRKITLNEERFPPSEFQDGDYHEAYRKVKEREGKTFDVYVPNQSVSTIEDERLKID